LTTEVRLTGLGSYLPRERISNAQLPPLDPPLSLEKLNAFGIASRARASEAETIVMMGLEAARSALTEAEVAPESLDFVILANWSERRYVPDLAPRLQYALGAKRAFAFDMCTACCGFVYGVSMASAFLRESRHQVGLVIASDRSTRRMRPGSRSTIVFGDGAAAGVVQAGFGARGRGFRIADHELRTNGEHNELMEVDGDGYLASHIRQNELNALAGRSMAEVARALLDRNGLSLDDIDYVVPHSGTAGVQAQLLEHLGVDPNKVLTNLPLIGNVTTASIPCSLRHFLDHGPLRETHTVLSLAVGLGWQYVGMLFRP
jgi:3-oxoacyl-[acyl-carrier-protein] synthase III